jgi:hypothetical protein
MALAASRYRKMSDKIMEILIPFEKIKNDLEWEESEGRTVKYPDFPEWREQLKMPMQNLHHSFADLNCVYSIRTLAESCASEEARRRKRMRGNSLRRNNGIKRRKEESPERIEKRIEAFYEMVYYRFESLIKEYKKREWEYTVKYLEHVLWFKKNYLQDDWSAEDKQKIVWLMTAILRDAGEDLAPLNLHAIVTNNVYGARIPLLLPPIPDCFDPKHRGK